MWKFIARWSILTHLFIESRPVDVKLGGPVRSWSPIAGVIVMPITEIENIIRIFGIRIRLRLIEIETGVCHIQNRYIPFFRLLIHVPDLFNGIAREIGKTEIVQTVGIVRVIGIKYASMPDK